MKKSSSFYPNRKSLNKLHNPSSIHKISSNPHNASPIRITSGSLRGRTLISPESSGTHPMGSREKLALFNMLMSELPQSKLQNLNILDAYAGSGALGIEALSRGAKSVVFVEKSPAVAKIIRQNLQNLGFSNHFEVKNQSVAEFIRKNSQTNQSKSIQNSFYKYDQFDHILADPPYDQFNHILADPPYDQFDLILADPPYDHFNALEISNLTTLLKPEGILALSHPGEAPEFENLTLLKTRSYARSHISLYRNY